MQSIRQSNVETPLLRGFEQTRPADRMPARHVLSEKHRKEALQLIEMSHMTAAQFAPGFEPIQRAAQAVAIDQLADRLGAALEQQHGAASRGLFDQPEPASTSGLR